MNIFYEDVIFFLKAYATLKRIQIILIVPIFHTVNDCNKKATHTQPHLIKNSKMKISHSILFKKKKKKFYSIYFFIFID